MSDPEKYMIGWICALPDELNAAMCMLDKRHPSPNELPQRDEGTYTLGEIDGHNVVITVLPSGEYGIPAAACVGRDLVRSFPNVRLGLMVGVGGGVPTNHDIRLGDVVVGNPEGVDSGLFQYNYGKALQDGRFDYTGHLDKPPVALRTAVAQLRANHAVILPFHRAVEEKYNKVKRYLNLFPKPADDLLYQSHIAHPSGKVGSCRETCGTEIDVLRERDIRITDIDDDPKIHYGLIASGNSLIKDAVLRDQLAAEKDVLCFEMEAAGLANHFPCLVVRGICDYADSHKNNDWQPYAAFTAAVYARELLKIMVPGQVAGSQRAKDILENMHADIKDMLNREKNHEHEEFVQWLTSTTYDTLHRDYLEKRVPGTGTWFLELSEFRTWLEEPSSILFCRGIPGAGKTIIATIAIDYLKRQHCENNRSAVAYIYFNYYQPERQNINSLLASFAQPVLKMYQTCKEANMLPSSEDLTHALMETMEAFDKVFIILDALDEYDRANSAHGDFLIKIRDLQRKIHFRMIITSRPNVDIEAIFGSCLRCEIQADEEDIHTYLDSHIAQLRLFTHGSNSPEKAELIATIKTTIAKAVQGMFLLTQLYIGSLEDKTSVREMAAAVMDFSKSSDTYSSEDHKLHLLNQAYSKTMQKLENSEPGFRELAKKTLTWVTFAREPLNSKALRYALAVEIGDTKFDPRGLRDISLILGSCRGLVTWDEKSDVVRLVHYTAQEYFLSNRSWFKDPHLMLAQVGMTYLSVESLSTVLKVECVTETWPLFQYVARHWGHHARESQAGAHPCFLEFLRKLDHYSDCHNIFEGKTFRLRGKETYTPTARSGLHLAAMFGLEDVIMMMIDEAGDIDAKDIHGNTPFLLATMGGHVSIMQLLWNRGARIDTYNRRGHTPLCEAVIRKHKASIQFLLDKDPFLIAAKEGFTTVVQELLYIIPNINFQNDKGRTALALAAKGGHIATINVLVSHGHAAIVDLIFNHYADLIESIAVVRALKSVASTEHIDVAQRLLDQYVLAEAQQEMSRSILEHTVDEYNMAMVRLLLEYDTYRTSLKADESLFQRLLRRAAGLGHANLFQLLLDLNPAADFEGAC
ncbi:hypothetical protein BDV25DRAFT_170327 [Aspergillus avenaceus]|uniref:Nucleoside phosphorylase domain-containing protein n=1 Tax=Aspergillus avenaceus TaxID=36643 RepID=A0A5N6U8R8_ASPAV|nr:hypothetical protein BDV25DRAFT_170327 [Aspergillus avenaceus]